MEIPVHMFIPVHMYAELVSFICPGGKCNMQLDASVHWVISLHYRITLNILYRNTSIRLIILFYCNVDMLGQAL